MTKKIDTPKPYWTAEQVKSVKKYLRSKEGKERIKKISEESSALQRKLSGEELSWEEWDRLVRTPFTI